MGGYRDRFGNATQTICATTPPHIEGERKQKKLLFFSEELFSCSSKQGVKAPLSIVICTVFNMIDISLLKLALLCVNKKPWYFRYNKIWVFLYSFTT